MNNISNMNHSIALIVARHRGKTSLRKFAAELSDEMPETISYQTIKNWQDGATKPAYYEMLAIALHYDDWRRQFALEILAVLKPDLYAPDQINIQSK